MWYAIYALLQATLAIVLQFVPYAPLKRFYWQAIIQVAAFLPIGLLWILNLLFSNSLINKMIDTALSLSLVSPFIVHWVGLGMLTIDLVWEDWLSVVFWTMYIVYGVGEIFMAMILSPPIYEYLENHEFRKETTTTIG